MALKKHATNKLVLSSFFKIITIDGKTEQVTTKVRRTLFFDDEDSFSFSKIKNVEVTKEIKESIPNDYVRYLVLLNLANGEKILVDEIGESSRRGGIKEMKNLGKKISTITGKTLKMFED
ncbi:MAG: hypothetical protein HRU72_03035 [Planctomycetia bacterium]|nr:hypothetical protein [Candidatus Brocadia sapporoensis]MCC7238952.1 hypothetical protein [Candidatus Brocadia sp.]MEB2307946.1 hypothetical protein [Candidatus Brocadiaceae bacterium]QOJ05590.1 MAG: hypothetical protein HRU72_03035 [Planctomycetia bacterium]RZV59732.1 MAG: hypothetical protein EX330_00720 [Candidatus Brocadia sp. BROELEC01]TVL97302.1 MAG: hypothetical protein CV082_04370 [Candidatus Brocadia sp. BL1]TWU50091.1 hypothetical protein B188_25200 [Candidatus Brocadiaceae bacter